MTVVHTPVTSERGGSGGIVANSPNGENGRRGSNASSYVQVRAREPESASLLRIETMSNADLYSMTPPAYAQSAADNEVSVDAEAIRDEKVGIAGASHNPSNTSPADGEQSRAVPGTIQAPNLELEREVSYASASTTAPSLENRPIPNELPPVYLSVQQRETAMASAKKCAILPSRPAIWLVKKKEFALSPLAATILVKEGIVRDKDLELISTSAGTKRDPNDPLSGFAFATYDTIGDILMGLVEGPVEAARQVVKLDEAKRNNPRGATTQQSHPHEATPLTQQYTVPETAPMDQDPPNAAISDQAGHKRAASFAAPNAAKEIAIAGGKGLGRIVGAGLKAPMTFTHGMTRGFHNMPKLYGEEVRQYENVTDMRSGMSVATKSLAYGLGDGLRDFFVQPVAGAKTGGPAGFVKGVGKGVGNLVCKPSAGLLGIVGYSSVGVYKQLQSLKPDRNNDAAAAFRAHGEMEFHQAPDQTRSEVVRRWCQMNMIKGR